MDDIFAGIDAGIEAAECDAAVRNRREIEAQVHKALGSCDPKMLDPIIAAPPPECQTSPAAKARFNKIVEEWREWMYATCLRR